MPRLLPGVAALALLGCIPKVDALANESSTSSGTSSESGSVSDLPGSADTDTAETGGDEPVDPCPAEPVLGDSRASFDGFEVGVDYPDQTDWDQACTVVAHDGDLINGESITLECIDAEGQTVEHVLEVQASVIDADQPTSIPVAIGEPLRLTLWSRVWWSGGASWILRNPDQPDDIRLVYYSTIDLPVPDNDGFAPKPEFLAPLEITLRDDVCATYCPDPDDPGTGNFVPDDCTCTREQALEFTFGPDTASVQHDSAGAVGPTWFAFVDTAAEFPLVGDCSDISGSWYAFIVVKR